MSTRSAFLSRSSSSLTWNCKQQSAKKFSSAVMSLFVLLQRFASFCVQTCSIVDFEMQLHQTSLQCCTPRDLLPLGCGEPETSLERLSCNNRRMFFNCFSMETGFSVGDDSAFFCLRLDLSYRREKKEEKVAGKELLSISSCTSSLAVCFVRSFRLCCLIYQLNWKVETRRKEVSWKVA